MKNHGIIVGALAVLAPSLVAGDEPRELPQVKAQLSQIRANPGAYRGLKVVFEAQFATTGQIQNPFFTRFVSSQYSNFWVWGGSQSIWRKEQYDDLFGLLFLSKDSDQMQSLFDLARYDRVRLTGIVRDIFQSKPWIEVTSIERLPGKLDTATLTHLYRGEEHMRRREWSRAISELSLAAGQGAPTHVLAAMHKDLGTCYLRLGEVDTARAHLLSASQLNGGRDTEVEDLLHTSQAAPSKALDRSVAAHKVPDARRPLWEAFEGVGARAGR